MGCKGYNVRSLPRNSIYVYQRKCISKVYNRVNFENAYLGDRISRNIISIVIRASFHEDVSCGPVATEIPVSRVVMIGIIIVASILSLEELVR